MFGRVRLRERSAERRVGRLRGVLLRQPDAAAIAFADRDARKSDGGAHLTSTNAAYRQFEHRWFQWRRRRPERCGNRRRRGNWRAVLPWPPPAFYYRRSTAAKKSNASGVFDEARGVKAPPPQSAVITSKVDEPPPPPPLDA